MRPATQQEDGRGMTAPLFLPSWFWGDLDPSFPGMGPSHILVCDVLIVKELSRRAEKTYGPLPLNLQVSLQRPYLVCDDKAHTRYYNNLLNSLYFLWNGGELS